LIAYFSVVLNAHYVSQSLFDGSYLKAQSIEFASMSRGCLEDRSRFAAEIREVGGVDMPRDERDERDERDGGHRETKRRKHSHGEKEGYRERRSRERGKELPFHARVLTKEDMEEYRGVFAKYLKDKKGIHIDDISSTEAYARFKSFVHKWYVKLKTR
jgi:hypothetical protein